MPDGVPGMENTRANGTEKVAVLMVLTLHLQSRVTKHLHNKII